MCPDLLRRAKKLVNVALTIADMQAPSWIIQKRCGLLQILKPPDAFLLLDGNSRRIDLFLQRCSPFELLPGPEFDGRQPKRQSLGRYRKARMHQDAADRMRSQPPRLVASTIYTFGDADRLRVLPRIGKLGRIMEHKHQAVSGGCAITSRLKMAGQNVRLADALIGEKAIGRLGVSPILTDQRNALPHGAPELRNQLPKSVAKPRIPKFASGDLSINPAISFSERLRSSPPRSVPQHKAHEHPPRSRIRCSAMNHK